MKAKTLIGLLSMTSSLYAISQNKELWEKVSHAAEKGKDTINELMDKSNDGGTGEEEFLSRFLNTIHLAKEELEQKIEETASKVYRKMNIAHTDQIEDLLNRINALEKSINLFEARLNKMK